MDDSDYGSSARNGGDKNNQSRKIFIGGLNYNTTEDGLKQHFGQYGEIVDVVVMKFPDTKRSRGFGFVTYSCPEEVDSCQSARPHIIDGKQVETKRATPREEFGKPEAGQTVKKVFVGGLKEDVEDEDVKEYFSQFGNVTSVTRVTDKESGKRRGFCFVEFDDYDPVDKAIHVGNHEINGRHVDVKKAISKEEINQMGGPRSARMQGGGGPRRGGGPDMGRQGGWGGRGGGRGGFGGGGGGPGPWGSSGGPWGAGGGDFYGGGGGYGGGGRGAGGAISPWEMQGGAGGGVGGWGGGAQAQGAWGAGAAGAGGWGAGGGDRGGWGAAAGGGAGFMGYPGAAYAPDAYGGGGPMRGAGGPGGYRSSPYGGGGAGGGGGGFRGGRGGGPGGFKRDTSF